jgi:hypothetical protein
MDIHVMAKSGHEATGERKTIIVLGTARSGTSMTGGLLDILGVDLGAVAYPEESTPTGAFEDEDIGRLHKDILKSAAQGKTYFDPPMPEQVLAQRDRFAERIQKLLLEKSSGKSLWGWKHPPTILTVELYLPYLVNPHFIVVFRNPLSIARSTVEHTSRFKDKLDICRALKLVNFYYGELFNFIERHPELPKLFISFEEIIGDPVREGARLAEFLGIELTEEKISKIEKLVIPREKIAAEKRKATGLLTGKIPRLINKKLVPLLRAGKKADR